MAKSTPNTKDLQSKVANFVKQNNWDSPVESRVLDLVSEAGEVAKEILKITNYGKKPVVKNKNLALELGDTFYSLIVIANKFDINLEDALDLVIKKYQKRLKKS